MSNSVIVLGTVRQAMGSLVAGNTQHTETQVPSTTSHVSNDSLWYTLAFLLMLLALAAEQAAVRQYNHSSFGFEAGLSELADKL